MRVRQRLNPVRWPWLFVLVSMLSACALVGGAPSVREFTAADFRAAAKFGRDARTAGRLPTGDRWPECFDVIAEKIETVEVPDPRGVGLAQAAMRLHIAVSDRGRPIDANCAQVVLELEMKGLKVGSMFVPGGAAAGGVLGTLRKLVP